MLVLSQHDGNKSIPIPKDAFVSKEWIEVLHTHDYKVMPECISVEI